MHLLDVGLAVGSGVAVVTATGEVDMTTVGLLAERLDRVHDLVPAPRAVVVDLSGVRFLAAAGVAVLLTAHLACGERGVPLWVVAPNRAVRYPLEVCGLTSLLHVVAERAATFAEP
ncbi:MAG TPA: STAS domain-containing protein [Umezawaea sp.]|jgi:anti-anti-sigma factor|nr:STAS domain-containing protein [Umezawaea sp.]